MKKQFVIGYIAGAATFGAIGAFAAGLAAAPNPFPVTFNGESVSIEGYNIDGSTYFKLRDIAGIVGGFEVDFKDDTIILKNTQGSPAPTPSAPAEAPAAFKAEAKAIIDDFEYEEMFLTQILPKIGYDEYERSIKAGLYNAEDMKLHIEELRSEYGETPAADKFLHIAEPCAEAFRVIYEDIAEYADALFPMYTYEETYEDISTQYSLIQAYIKHMNEVFDNEL